MREIGVDGNDPTKTRKGCPRTDPVKRKLRRSMAKLRIRRSVRPLSISKEPSVKQRRKKARWLMA
jgi:hypothetical protein